MIVVVTSIQLKSPFSLFKHYQFAVGSILQLKANSSCIGFKTGGFYPKQFTMSLWNNTEEMKKYARTGTHLQAMQHARSVATEVQTISFEATELPNWKVAKEKLLAGKKITY